jgi:hypothetical protein
MDLRVTQSCFDMASATVYASLFPSVSCFKEMIVAAAMRVVEVRPAAGLSFCLLKAAERRLYSDPPGFVEKMLMEGTIHSDSGP